MKKEKSRKLCARSWKCWETELAGRRVFRYMEGEEIREIYGEQFFRNIRETACLIRQKQLEGEEDWYYREKQLRVDSKPVWNNSGPGL